VTRSASARRCRRLRSAWPRRGQVVIHLPMLDLAADWPVGVHPLVQQGGMLRLENLAQRDSHAEYDGRGRPPRLPIARLAGSPEIAPIASPLRPPSAGWTRRGGSSRRLRRSLRHICISRMAQLGVGSAAQGSARPNNRRRGHTASGFPGRQGEHDTKAGQSGHKLSLQGVLERSGAGVEPTNRWATTACRF
jgi:hypothetical protein